MTKYMCFMDFEYTTTGNKAYDKNNDGIEIISIAGVIIDQNYNTVKEFHELARPIKNFKLHPFCTELTGITQEMVDNANFFNKVADNFMTFIQEYISDENELFIYTWGDMDIDAIDRTFKINQYTGDFEYVRNKIVNIQKRICCSIFYKKKPIKSVWSLQDVKSIYNLPISSFQHNALYDARDLRDVYISYKLRHPRNKKMIQYFYEKSSSCKILKYLDKTLYFDFIPGELKYGLANLFKKTVNYSEDDVQLEFNKKTMSFKQYKDKNNIIFDTELIRYSKIQMITDVIYKKEIICKQERERAVFRIRFTCVSKKPGDDIEINTTHYFPMNMRNLIHVGIFFRTMKEYDKLYDINNRFNNKYNINMQ